jgi:hypothetical protein|tara:strand:- start:240 stop:395 length:156 start_codon:yes stop_codon:yes gene_type:complete
MNLIVCEDCEAEFRIKHAMDEKMYRIMYCPFCCENIEEELKDEIEWEDDND